MRVKDTGISPHLGTTAIQVMYSIISCGAKRLIKSAINADTMMRAILYATNTALFSCNRVILSIIIIKFYNKSEYSLYFLV